MIKLQTLTLTALLTASTSLFAGDVTRAQTGDAAPHQISDNGQTRGPFAYDRSTRTLFVHGQSYHVPESVNTVRLWNADQIALTWAAEGDRRVVQSYSVQSEDDDA